MTALLEELTTDFGLRSAILCLAFAVSYAPTLATTTTRPSAAGGKPDQVVAGEGMPAAADELASIPRAGGLATQDVHAVRDGLQVVGVYATPSAARMVEGQAARNGSHGAFVDPPGCPTSSSLVLELGVPIGVATGLPEVALGGGINDHLLSKAVHCWAGRSSGASHLVLPGNIGRHMDSGN